MEIILMLLAITGISFAIKQANGPFDIIARIRNLLGRIPYLGPMIFLILTCNFCLGCWVSAALYLSINFGNASIGELVVWTFGGGNFNALFNKIMDYFKIAD